MGGVDCYAGSILDLSLGDLPGYEAEMRAALTEHVEPGDSVRIVGGGYGVTAIVAHELSGEPVEVMEAARENVGCCRRTADLHGLGSEIRVHHGAIGYVLNAWGAQVGPRRSVEWCRGCDVLEVDCEGGEAMILNQLDQSGPLPRVLLVESHGHLGSPTTRVREQVRDLGYRVVSEEFEEEDDDVAVLACVRVEDR